MFQEVTATCNCRRITENNFYNFVKYLNTFEMKLFLTMKNWGEHTYFLYFFKFEGSSNLKSDSNCFLSEYRIKKKKISYGQIHRPFLVLSVFSTSCSALCIKLHAPSGFNSVTLSTLLHNSWRCFSKCQVLSEHGTFRRLQTI